MLPRGWVATDIDTKHSKSVFYINHLRSCRLDVLKDYCTTYFLHAHLTSNLPGFDDLRKSLCCPYATQKLLLNASKIPSCSFFVASLSLTIAKDKLVDFYVATLCNLVTSVIHN